MPAVAKTVIETVNVSVIEPVIEKIIPEQTRKKVSGAFKNITTSLHNIGTNIKDTLINQHSEPLQERVRFAMAATGVATVIGLLTAAALRVLPSEEQMDNVATLLNKAMRSSKY